MGKKVTLQLATCLATLGPIGYLVAPGTMGTLATLPLAYALSYTSCVQQFLCIIIGSYVSYVVIHRALKNFTSHDPSCIILDEVMGTLVTFYGIAWSPQAFLVGFILFRLHDIYKPFGIRYIEKIPGAWGVLLDDIAAGCIANIILRLLSL